MSSQSVQNAPFTIAKGLTALIQSVSLLVSFFGLLLFLSPLLAALVLLSAVPHLLIHFRFGRDRFKLAFDLSPLQRDAFYFSHVLTGLQAAKEMRLFGLRRYLLGRWRQVATQNNQAQRDLQRRELKWKLGLELLSFLVMGLAYYFILRGIFNSQLTVGDIALYGSAVAGVQMGIVALVRATAQVAEVHLFFGQYETIKRLPQPIHIVAAPLPTVPLRQGIVFEDVWFRYRDDAPWVLRGVSFEIPAERCVALVGVNGAGKSTLVKLLTRLYDPTRGRILWDGIDIHNRWLGAGERGTDLSGGQWQRLAIARAFMRSADLLLLDEPTAMLDAAAEAQLVRLFAQMKREHTSLLISHRFSTVKLADHIIVLDGGVVVEHGAHDALMGLGQQYAHLYAAQADLFQHVTGTV